jgi:arginine/ornithine transport system substrate-binding protein
VVAVFRILLGIGIALLCGCATGPRTSSEEEDGTITVAIDPLQVLPFRAETAAGFEGFEPDLISALCARMQVKCRFVKLHTMQMFKSVAEEEVEAALSVEVSHGPKAQIAFTAPYLHPPYAFLRRKGSDLAVTKDGLRGKIIGIDRTCPDVELPAEEADYLTREFGDGVRIKPYDLLSKCDLDLMLSNTDTRQQRLRQLHDLDAGVIDGIFADKFVLHTFNVRAGERYEFVGPDVFDFATKHVIIVPSGRSDLLNAFNAALDSMIKDGTYQQLEARYFPFDMYGPL